MAFRRPIESVLIKPAGPDCNMACGYCFYLKKADLFGNSGHHRMSDEVLRATVKQVMQRGGRQVSFGWQGGEPTLMGVEFFEQAVEYQKTYGRPGQVVGNGLQTNGLLINDRWVRFLSENQFLVGLSLDGPEHVHDHYRHRTNTRGSWSKVMDAAKLLLDGGVAVNALTVITDHSAKHPEEIYRFLKEQALSWMQFIPCVERDSNNPTRAADFSVSARAYGEFLIAVFDLWYADLQRTGQPETNIRFFESVFHRYLGRTPPDCHLLPECGVYTVIEHNGDIFTCDFFVDPEWKLGNVLTDDLLDALHSPRMKEFGALKGDLPDECTACQWLPNCYGGCTKDRRMDPADQGSNHFCESMMMFFEHADPILRKLAEQWKRARKQERMA